MYGFKFWVAFDEFPQYGDGQRFWVQKFKVQRLYISRKKSVVKRHQAAAGTPMLSVAHEPLNPEP
jgi:hypothetical protein